MKRVWLPVVAVAGFLLIGGLPVLALTLAAHESTGSTEPADSGEFRPGAGPPWREDGDDWGPRFDDDDDGRPGPRMWHSWPKGETPGLGPGMGLGLGPGMGMGLGRWQGDEETVRCVQALVEDRLDDLRDVLPESDGGAPGLTPRERQRLGADLRDLGRQLREDIRDECLTTTPS